MKIDPGMVQTSDAQSMRSSPGKAPPVREQGTRQIAEKQQAVQNGSEPEEKRVAPEEILDRIKEISQDGLYSIRFEKSDEINGIIVKVVDRKTDEVIRQIPPEAILGVKANLMDYLGNIVNKYS